ncbi:MAG: ABC transporter ATP-binding protein [Lachnospiraceae bacterium]|nr:ABC transporter ATP-binding protein [Lachnospiraceae bacterium]
MKQDNAFVLYHKLVQKSRKWIPLFVLCTAVAGVSLFLIFSTVGVFLTQIVSAAQTGTGLETLKKAILYLAVVVIFALLAGASMTGFTYMEQNVQRVLREEMVRRYLHAPEGTAAVFSPAEILNRINYDLPEAGKLVGYYISAWIFQPMLSGLLSIVFLAAVDWSVAVLCLACSAVNMLVMHLAAGRLRNLNAAMTEGRSGIIRFLKECVEGAAEIRTFQMYGRFEKKLEARLEKTAHVTIKYRHLEALRRAVMVLFADCITILALLILGALLASHGYVRFSDIMLALPLSDQIGQGMIAVSNFPALIKQGSPNMERVFEIAELPSEEEDRAVKTAVSGPEASRSQMPGPKASESEASGLDITFDDVSFSYGKMPILKHVTFQVKQGEKVAFVGESGGGKSTVIKLLLGLYLPDGGSISLGEETLEASSLAGWREKFAYLPQDISMFHTSIEENIALCKSAERENRLSPMERGSVSAVTAAAKAAGADSFIAESKEGYGTLLGEGNAGFSGGQLQRIALARAMFRRAPVLLMDEPTSALDPQSEQVVKKTFRQLPDDLTVIAVTHRLALTTEFDRIYVLEQGQIAEAGSHAELLEKGRKYADLWQSQQEGETGVSRPLEPL